VGKTARCAPCCGGVATVLMGATRPAFEVDLVPLGLVSADARTTASLTLQPPVPPPLPAA
jgi:hypothetical protein